MKTANQLPTDAAMFGASGFRRKSGVNPLGCVALPELSMIPLFAHVSPEVVRQLGESALEQRVAVGAKIIEQGEECNALHSVLDGTVEVISSFDEQETVIDVVGPGGTLLLASVMSGIPFVGGASALSPARILSVPVAVVQELFDSSSAFARAVVVELSLGSNTLMTELCSVKTRTSMQRVVDWLLDADAQANGKGSFRLPFGKRTLASRLGMTPECLSRTLRTLGQHGLSVRGREITVTDRARLDAYGGTGAGF